MILENVTGFTIYEVERIKELLLKALKEEDFLLDMSKIEKIDMVGVQLLLSFIKSAELANKQVKLFNLSTNLLEQIEPMHCSEALGITNG